MNNSRDPSPGAARHPDHKVVIIDNPGRFVVTINGETVAQSTATLAVDETGYDRVIYFPPQDIRERLLQKSTTRTTCPFKGEAQYFAAEIEGKTEDIAWFYPAVYAEVAPIEGYVAFYADRVELSATQI